MFRLPSPALVLLACCLTLTPLAGCGAKKEPKTIASLLAKAKKNPKAEGRARDLAKVAGMQVDVKDKKGAVSTLELAIAEIPADGQPLVCVPVLVEIAETYAQLGQRSSAKKVVESAVKLAAGLEDPLGRSQLLAQIGVVQGSRDGGLGDSKAAEATLGEAAKLAGEDVAERFRGKALAAVAMGYADAGLADKAEGMIGTLEELAATLEEKRPKAEAFAAAAAVRAAAGDKQAAAKLLDQAASAAKGIDDLPANRVFALVAVAKALAANGDKKAATALLADAEKSAAKVPDPQMQKDALKAVRVLQAKLKG